MIVRLVAKDGTERLYETHGTFAPMMYWKIAIPVWIGERIIMYERIAAHDDELVYREAE